MDRHKFTKKIWELIRRAFWTGTVAVWTGTTFFPATAPAEPPPPVLKLVGAQSCATAFPIATDRLITNAHVTQRNCRDRLCKIELSQNGQALHFATATLIDEINAFDIAVIRLDGAPPLQYFELAENEPEIGQAVTILGYPRCGDLTKTGGTVSSTDAIHIFSTAGIKHGSSGGPALGSDGKVDGIVSQIADPLTGFLSSLTHISGNSKLVRAGVIRRLIGQAPMDRLLTSANISINFIKNDLSRMSGLSRILADGDLALLIRGIILDSPIPPPALVWTLLDEADLHNFPVGADSAPVQSVAALAFMEQRDTNFLANPANYSELTRRLSNSNPTELREIAATLARYSPGTLPLMGRYIMIFLLISLGWAAASGAIVMAGQATLKTRSIRLLACLLTPVLGLALWIIV